MLSKVEELKLISQIVLSDDRRAFARLVDAYQPILHNFFLNLTGGNEALCDDLAQETFIKAYTNIRQFRGLSHFKTWLFRIAYNNFTPTLGALAKSFPTNPSSLPICSLAMWKATMPEWMFSLPCSTSLPTNAP